MKIPEQYTSLEYIHDIDWHDIFAVWRSHEAYQRDWQRHWTECGFDSWDTWRTSYIAPLVPNSRKWKIYRIMDTAHDVQLMYGVPSRGWQAKCYDGTSTKRIADILSHPVVTRNPKVQFIKESFPFQTMLMGVLHENKIVLIEGMHRACALAQMENQFGGDVVIALTTYEGDLPTIGKGEYVI